MAILNNILKIASFRGVGPVTFTRINEHVEKTYSDELTDLNEHLFSVGDISDSLTFLKNDEIEFMLMTCQELGATYLRIESI